MNNARFNTFNRLEVLPLIVPERRRKSSPHSGSSHRPRDEDCTRYVVSKLVEAGEFTHKEVDKLNPPGF
jgi:hypothetical protein